MQDDFRPFDDGNAVGYDFVEAEFKKLLRRFEAIAVKVPNFRSFGAVGVHDRKRRTGNVVNRFVQESYKVPGKGGFSASQVS
jgi:hypothetical protein